MFLPFALVVDHLPYEQLNPARVGLIVQERRLHGTSPVERVEVEARVAEVHERLRIVHTLEARVCVESDVVVDELSQVGIPGGDFLIVDKTRLGHTIREVA
jgi:hypothetical protein